MTWTTPTPALSFRNKPVPVRFRTIKLVTYAVRKRGGWVDKHPGAMPSYTVQLPNKEELGPFNRDQLLSWANFNL